MTLSISHRAILRLLLVLMLAGLESQSALTQPVTPEEELDYIVEDFILPGGRLGNNVNIVTEGPNGFLWFGSHGGVHRYDGYDFITYKNDPADTLGQSTSLTYPYTEHLYWDNEGILWVSTYGGGLFRFDPNTEKFKHFRHDPNDESTISNFRVMWAQEDNEGRLWFSTEHGLNRFDRETGTFKRYYPFGGPENILDHNFKNILLDSQGTLWVSAGNAPWTNNIGGLLRYEPESDSFTIFKNPSGSIATRGLFEDSQGNFWVGNMEGLNRFDRQSGEFELFDHHPEKPHASGSMDRSSQVVYSILEDKKGGLWTGTMGALGYPVHVSRFDPNTGKTQYLPTQLVGWQLFESSDGTIWVSSGSISGKVVRIKPKVVTYDLEGGDFYEDAFRSDQHSDIPENIDRSFFSGIAPLDIGFDKTTGNIWGTHMAPDAKGGAQAILSEYDPNNGMIIFHHLSSLNNYRTNDAPNQFATSGIRVGEDGKVWGSYTSENVGVFCFDPKSDELVHFRHDPDDSTSISSNFIVEVYMDRRGDIWACSYEQGLNHINAQTGEVTRIDLSYEDNFPSLENFPIAVVEDTSGYVYVGGNIRHLDTQFLVKINPYDFSMESFPILSNYAHNNISIRSMAIDKSDNSIGFTLNNRGMGIFLPWNQTFLFFNTQEGNYPLDVTRKILADRYDNFWVSTREGIFIRDQRGNTTIHNASGNGSLHRKGTVSPDGDVYFLGDDMWYHIDPDIVGFGNERDSFDLHLVDLFILGEKEEPSPNGILKKPLWESDFVQLPHSSENFAIKFTDFDFQERGKIYQYRLYPYESSWNKTNNSLTANYFQIPPGTYTFQARSITSDIDSPSSSVELEIKVLPPWWATVWAYVLYGLTFILGAWMVHKTQKARTIRIEREKTRERELEQARIIEKAYNQLEVAHTDLKATQAQLIQSEKMASLGELTAGIAHEIQNPLNFVNNFSEVNSELISDLKEGIKAGNFDEVGELLNDLEQNEQKIAHHGKRADSIVKGMLQHSRTDSGERTPTDINALCEEYLRIAYHGLRAKDITFNADLKTSFAQLENISVVPQDISRVLLNIITNAFHAVHQRRNLETQASENGNKISYQPTVSIETSKQNGNCIINVRDNGGGIPKDIKDKIFQPFFTTKPTGQGTGLGLSLAFDIVTAHGGSLEVESEMGEGTAFRILLPVD